MIEINNIYKSFGDVHVLKGLSFSVDNGGFVGIIGSSGSGKSTLMHIIGTLDVPDSGTILIEGQDISQLSKHEVAEFRNQQIGFVFQFHHLLPEFTALENVMIPGLIASKDKVEVEEKAKELLSYLKLDHRFEHKPSQLSGGEQQRVAVARAMINNPSILLADEPTGNLDNKLAKELHELLLKMRADFNQTILIVTHDINLAQGCDKIIKLVDGKVSEEI